VQAGFLQVLVDQRPLVRLREQPSRGAALLVTAELGMQRPGLVDLQELGIGLGLDREQGGTPRMLCLLPKFLRMRFFSVNE